MSTHHRQHDTPRGGSDRRAVRVVCIDADGRILLMHWKLGNAAPYWEPPGGGIEGDEDPLAAARREFSEETGLPARAVRNTSVPVARDFAWFGTPIDRTERFYLARVSGSFQDIRPPGLSTQEQNWLLGYGWFGPSEIEAFTGHVEPPELLTVVKELTEAPL